MSRPTRFPKCVAADEGGMVSLLSLLALLGLLVLFGLLANIGRTANQKLEVQSGADAVAYSAGNQMARGMNTVTAVNHLIGELSAFVILHHGFGGDPLIGRVKLRPRRTPKRCCCGAPTNSPDWRRDWRTCRSRTRAGTTRSGRIREKSDDDERDVGGAPWDSRIRLKHVAVWSYTVHAIGGFLNVVAQYIPVFGPIITGLLYALFVLPALAFEYKAYQEALVLNALERGARVLKPVRQTVEDYVIPGLRYYTVAVFWNTPRLAENAAEEVGNRNLVSGKLYPGFLKNPSYPWLSLPLTAEPESPRVPVRSQLMRAATPWVQHWRVPWLKFGEDALLLTDRFRREGGVLLYHMNGYDPDRQEIRVRGVADGGRQTGGGPAVRADRVRPPAEAERGVIRGVPPDQPERHGRLRAGVHLQRQPEPANDRRRVPTGRLLRHVELVERRPRPPRPAAVG